MPSRPLVVESQNLRCWIKRAADSRGQTTLFPILSLSVRQAKDCQYIFLHIKKSSRSYTTVFFCYQHHFPRGRSCRVYFARKFQTDSKCYTYAARFDWTAILNLLKQPMLSEECRVDLSLSKVRIAWLAKKIGRQQRTDQTNNGAIAPSADTPQQRRVAPATHHVAAAASV